MQAISDIFTMGNKIRGEEFPVSLSYMDEDFSPADLDRPPVLIGKTGIFRRKTFFSRVTMNLESSTELVKCFLSAPEERNRIKDELFARLYEDFNRRIHSVLHLSGIKYVAESDFYNVIFMDLYHQLFDVESLERKLIRFDPEKGEFEKWFLNAVVVNEVKDWLKSVDDSTGMKRCDLIRENQRMENESLSLDRPIDPNDFSSPGMGERIASTEYSMVAPDLTPVLECAEEDTLIKHQVAQSLLGLSSKQRTLVLLFYCAYLPLEEGDIQQIAETTENSVEKVRMQVDALRDKLIDSPKYQQEECLEKETACLKNQIEIFYKRLYRIKKELGQGPDTKTLDKDVASLSEQPIGELNKKIDNLKKSPYSKQQKKEILIHQAALLNKRIMKLEKKRQNQLNLLSGGKTVITASYRDMAELLDIPEGTVASGISRAIRNFKAGFCQDNEPNNEQVFS